MFPKLNVYSTISLENLKHAFLHLVPIYVGWNFNSGNYLFTTDTK